MTVRAKAGLMATVTFFGIGPRLDRMKKFPITLVDTFRHIVTSLMTINTKKRFVAHGTLSLISLGILLVLDIPSGTMGIRHIFPIALIDARIHHPPDTQEADDN